LRESGVLTLDRVRAGDFLWKSNATGAFFQRFHNALPAIGAAGNNLIVVHIVETREWMASLVSLLSSFDVYFVAYAVRWSNFKRGNWREELDPSQGTVSH
jgi:chloramphenicol 3-O phosphotransferase